MKLCIDIETAGRWQNYTDVPEVYKRIVEKQALRKEMEPSDFYYKEASLRPELGQVVGIGLCYSHNGEYRDDIKVTDGDWNELALLNYLNKLLQRDIILVGHNINEFDIPFLIKRMMFYGIRPAKTLNIVGKKPWEIKHIDTRKLYMFGNYSAWSSMDLVSTHLGIESPKDEFDGSKVHAAFHSREYHLIAAYLKKEMFAQYEVLSKFEELVL